MVKAEVQAEIDQIMVGFRQECLRVLEEATRLRCTLLEPPEGWREYFTRRVYTALLKYKDQVEAVVQTHLTADEGA